MDAIGDARAWEPVERWPPGLVAPGPVPGYGPSMKRFYADDGFEFDRLNLLGSAYRGLTDIGEVLVALDQIPDGDREAWVSTFAALGARLLQQGEASLTAGHRASARSALLRASSYFAAASSASPGSADPSRYDTLWTSHRAAWDAAVPLFDPPVEPIAIPYEGTTMAGYFFHARSPHGRTADPAPRKTLILVNGSDGAVTDMWRFGAAAAIERGWNALTFDGPGQNAALHRQHIFFRADWEHVISPVVDWLLQRPDVDGERIAIAGISQAGYWVPRALAFEHRIAAAVADPGVVRVGDSWLTPLPDIMKQLLDQGDKADFDTFMQEGLKDEPDKLAVLRWRMAPYGTDSFYDAYQAAIAMHLDADTLAKITCPLLITSPDHEQFWPGQSNEMHRAVPGSTLLRFTEAEGADWHCEPAACGLQNERVFDWLDDAVAAVRPKP